MLVERLVEGVGRLLLKGGVGRPLLEGGVGTSLLKVWEFFLFLLCAISKNQTPKKIPKIAAPAIPSPGNETNDYSGFHFCIVNLSKNVKMC